MAEESNYALEAINLSKDFGKVKAVKEVNLKIKKGEIYALIGPNGAGKTTLIKTFVGLLSPSKGKIEILGTDVTLKPISAKAKIGYVPDDPSSYNFLTGREFLALTGKLRGMEKENLLKRIEELSKLFPIKEVFDNRIEDYSRGNKQKISFLSALLSEPSILIIDEPIVGLDPLSIDIFGNTLKEFSDKGGTVFFATHILEFAKEFSHRVGVMKEGTIIEEEENKGKLSLDKIYEKATE